MKRKRGATLVELTVSLVVAALLLFVAGRLLFDALEVWRVQADREATVRRCTLMLDRMAADLVSQPDWPELSAPVEAFSLGEWGSTGPSLSFLTSGAGQDCRSVCWYLDGDAPWTLHRCEVGEADTEEKFPDNAAGMLVAAGLSGEDMDAEEKLDEASSVACRGLVSLSMENPEGSAGPQIFLCVRTAEGIRRIKAGEPASELPDRCTVRIVRPIPSVPGR